MQMALSIEQIAEYIKCYNDPVYFIETYIKTMSPMHGLIPLKLHEHQIGYINAVQEYQKLIVSTPRQSGNTCTTLAFLLWSAIFVYNQTILVVEPKQVLAFEANEKIRLMLELLPEWMKPTLRYCNKSAIELDNGSKILFECASRNTGKGMSLNILWLGDFSFVKHSIQQELWESLLPTMSAASRLIVSSTRSRHHEDLFEQLWDDAVKGKSELKAHNISFWDLPGASREKLDQYIKMMGINRASCETNTPIEIEA